MADTKEMANILLAKCMAILALTSSKEASFELDIGERKADAPPMKESQGKFQAILSLNGVPVTHAYFDNLEAAKTAGHSLTKSLVAVLGATVLDEAEFEGEAATKHHKAMKERGPLTVEPRPLKPTDED